ncbi:hypothetical protein CsSME_00040034 [Camellia sinensis var. sinensis]
MEEARPLAPPLSAAATVSESTTCGRSEDYHQLLPAVSSGGAKRSYSSCDTRIIVSDRHSSLADLTHCLSKTLLHDRSLSTLSLSLSLTLRIRR